MNDGKAGIYRTVAQLAAERGSMDVTRITPQTHFINDLNFDSLTMVEFVMAAEDRFKLTVPEDAVQQMQTVGQVADYIAQQTAGRDDEPDGSS